MQDVAGEYCIIVITLDHYKEITLREWLADYLEDAPYKVTPKKIEKVQFQSITTLVGFDFTNFYRFGAYYTVFLSICAYDIVGCS